jgi:site-specific recombinase XerD
VNDLLSQLTRSLRWMARHTTLTDIGNLTPALWFDYLDARLEAGRSPNTVNGKLSELQQFLLFLADQDRPICQRMLRMKRLKKDAPLPRDVPLDQLRLLLQQIETEANSSHAGRRRMGVLDRAWFLLMLHSGLRTGEVRRLRFSDLDIEGQRVRIEQSKGLRDRIVCSVRRRWRRCTDTWSCAVRRPATTSSSTATCR